MSEMNPLTDGYAGDDWSVGPDAVRFSPDEQRPTFQVRVVAITHEFQRQLDVAAAALKGMSPITYAASRMRFKGGRHPKLRNRAEWGKHPVAVKGRKNR